MAIYHQSIKPVQRSAGKSAVAAAAYRSRSTLHDVRQGMTFSYTAKQDLVHAEIVGFAGDRGSLWNLAEAMETRKDATVAREYEVALPIELDTADQIELLREFAQWLNEEYGCVVDFAFHSGHSGEGVNPHGHMLTTTRSVDAYGTMSDIKISREWSDKKRKAHGFPGRKSEVKKARKKWEEITNAALDRSGIEARIDHRSYADQGIDRLPTSHIGPAATAMERDGIQTRAGDHNRMIGQINLERQFELDDLRKREANADALAQQLADIDAEIEAIRNEPAPPPTTIGTIIQSGHSESIAAVAERESARYSYGMAKTIGEQYKLRLFRSTWNADINPKLLKWVDVESRALTLKTGEQIRDHGEKLSLSKGSDDGIEAAIAMAKAKGWESVSISGSDDFQLRAALALQEAGIKPTVNSEIAKKQFSDILRERDAAAQKQEPKPDPEPDPEPKPEIHIEALKDRVRNAFLASPLASIRVQQDNPKRLEKWVRDRWDELTKNGEPEGFADAFRELAEEQAYLAGYSVQSVQAVGIDDELSKSMSGYKAPKPLPSGTSDKPSEQQGQRQTWYPATGQKPPDT